MKKKRKYERELKTSGSEPIRDYRAVGARARCAFTRALNAVNALSGTTSLLSPSATNAVSFLVLQCIVKCVTNKE